MDQLNWVVAGVLNFLHSVMDYLAVLVILDCFYLTAFLVLFSSPLILQSCLILFLFWQIMLVWKFNPLDRRSIQ